MCTVNPLLFVCCTVQNEVVDILFFIFITYHTIYLFICVSVSIVQLCIGVFILALFNMFDDVIIKVIEIFCNFLMLSSVKFIIFVPYRSDGREILFQKVFAINNLLQLFSIILYVIFAIFLAFSIMFLFVS